MVKKAETVRINAAPRFSRFVRSMPPREAHELCRLAGTLNATWWKGNRPRSVMISHVLSVEANQYGYRVETALQRGDFDALVYTGGAVQQFQIYPETDFNAIDFGQLVPDPPQPKPIITLIDDPERDFEKLAALQVGDLVQFSGNAMHTTPAPLIYAGPPPKCDHCPDAAWWRHESPGEPTRRLCDRCLEALKGSDFAAGLRQHYRDCMRQQKKF